MPILNPMNTAEGAQVNYHVVPHPTIWDPASNTTTVQLASFVAQGQYPALPGETFIFTGPMTPEQAEQAILLRDGWQNATIVS